MPKKRQPQRQPRHAATKPPATSSGGIPKKRPVGRPRLIESPEQAQEKIDAYFEECGQTKEPYTIPGLAYALGFDSRHAIMEYERKPEYSSTMKTARLKIECQRNQQLLKDGQVIGKIFDLKNNFGWIDRQELTGADSSPLLNMRVEFINTKVLDDDTEKKPQGAISG